MRKHYNVSQRAEAVARAVVKRHKLFGRGRISEAVQMMVYAVARKCWAQGYRTALKEVRRAYYSYTTDSEGTVELIHAKALDEFLKDTNRLQ